MNERIEMGSPGQYRRRRRRPGQSDGGLRSRPQHHADTHGDENATTGTTPAAVVASEDGCRTHIAAAEGFSSRQSVVMLTILLLARHQGSGSAADVLSSAIENNAISKLGEAVTSTTQLPHFPHATFIAHGHPSDPHTHHLHATTYRYYHHSSHLPSHLEQHHDWFHATINDVEPTRLHGGFTYTDAHVPTPLTHRKYEHRDQTGIVGDGDADGNGDGNGDTDETEFVAHHYFSVPGIFAPDDGADSSFPDFDEFQHNVEEKMHIDEEVQKRIDYNVDHPNRKVGSTSVEDLSDIIQTITTKEKARPAKTDESTGAADNIDTQPVSVASWLDILGIRQFLFDASLAGLSGHMIALERNCEDEGSVEPLALLADAEVESTATSDIIGSNQQNAKETEESTELPSSENNNAEGFKLSMREIFKAMQSTSAVAGMSSDASVAAAAMASVAVEAEKDIKRQDDMVEMSLAYPKLPASEKDAQKHAGKQFVVKRDADVGDEARGLHRRRSSAGSDSNSFSDQTDFPELDPFAIETSHLLSASFALVSNSFGLVADTVRILGDTAGAATSASIKVVGATVKSVSGGLEGAGKRIELGRAGLREEALLEASKSKTGEKSHPKKRQPLTSEKLLSGEKGGVIGLLHRDQEDQPRPLVRGTRRVLGKSVRLLASVGSGIGESLLFAGSATETLASSTAGVAEEAVRLFEDFAGSLSSAFQVKEGKHFQDKQPVAPPSATKISDWYPLDSMQQKRPSIVSFGRHDGENLDDGESMEDDGAKSTEIENESFIESSQRLLRFVVSESIAFVDFSLADTEDVPSEVPELLGILLLCFVSSIILLSSSSSGDESKAFPPTDESKEVKKGNARPEGKDISQQAVPPIPTHVIRPNRPHRASYCVGAGILIGGEKHEDTLDSDSLTVDEIDPIAKQEPITDPKPSEETEENTPPAALRLPRRVLACIWLLLRAFMIEPFHVTFCIIRFWVLFFLDRRVILMGIYSVAGLYVSRASQLRSLAIARNAEASGFRSVMTAAASGSTIRESAVWFNGLLDEMWRVPVVEDAMEVSQPNLSEEYPSFITKAMKHALRKRSCRKVTGRNNRGESSVLCTDKKPYGGLEPYISSILGESVIDILKTTSASRPSDITYIYLNSFTLGSVPPIIRAVKLTSMNDDDSTVKFDVDLDVLLGDSSIVLDIKLSTLDYALLPSTQVAIHSFDMRLPLELTVEMMHQYPFVKGIKASLTKVPPCRVRVTPLSENSGLKGVDLGSLPVLNDWIQEALHDALEDYLAPSYIAFDIKSLFYPPDELDMLARDFVDDDDDNANAAQTGPIISVETTEEKEIQRPQVSLSSSLASEKATAAINEPIQLNSFRLAMDVQQQLEGSEENTLIIAAANDGEIIMNRRSSSFDTIASQMAISNEAEEPSLKEFETAAAGGKKEKHAEIRKKWWGKRK